MSIKINRLEEGHNSHPLVCRRPAYQCLVYFSNDIVFIVLHLTFDALYAVILVRCDSILTLYIFHILLRFFSIQCISNGRCYVLSKSKHKFHISLKSKLSIDMQVVGIPMGANCAPLLADLFQFWRIYQWKKFCKSRIIDR
jgi:hypothetical protein